MRSKPKGIDKAARQPLPARGPLGLGLALLAGLFAIHLYRLGVFHIPFLMDDYLFAYWAHFHEPVPAWAWPEPLMPYLRPVPYYGLWPLVLSFGTGDGGAMAARLLAFALVVAAGGFQLALWKRLGAGNGEALALVAAFFLASWQVVLVGWTTALSDTLSVLAVSAALYFAVSGGAYVAVLLWVVALLSKQTALLVAPVVAAFVIWAVREHGPRTWSRRSLLIGTALVGLGFTVWSTGIWFVAGGGEIDATRFAVDGAVGKLLAPLLSLLNLADLPAAADTALLHLVLPLAMGVLVGVVALLARGRAGVGAVAPRRLAIWGWLLVALGTALGALFLPYPWSSYLIAPLWPALILPVVLVRGKLRSVLVALVLCVHILGGSVLALPVARNDAQVQTIASHHSAGRILVLGKMVGPVQAVAETVAKDGAREFYVKGLPKNAWVGFGDGLSGAMWVDDPGVRAYSVSQTYQEPDLSVPGGYIIYSGTQFDSETTAISYADYREVLARLDSLAMLPPAQAVDSFHALESYPPWSAVATWARDGALMNTAAKARAQGRQAVLDTLTQAGWQAYGQTQCGNAVAGRLIERGQLAAAKAVLDQLVASGRDRGDTHFLYALVFVQQNRLAEARASLERARPLGIATELEPMASSLDAYLANNGFPPPSK